MPLCVVQFYLDDVRYVDAGETVTVGPEVQTPFTGVPPDKPVGAFAGQLLRKVRLENGEAGSLPDFYGVRYGDFLIGMNCTFGKTFLFSPPGFAGGLISRASQTSPKTFLKRLTSLRYELWVCWVRRCPQNASSKVGSGSRSRLR